MKKKIFELFKMFAFMIYDSFAIIISYLFTTYTFSLFPGLQVEYINRGTLFKALPLICLFTIVVFYVIRIYRSVIKHIGMFEISRIIFAIISLNVIAVLLLASFDWLGAPHLIFMYKSGYFIITTVQLLLIVGIRIIGRIINVVNQYRFIRKSGPRYLIVGAGTAGKIALDEIYRLDAHAYVVGFVDDKPTLKNKFIGNVRIVGSIEDIESFINDFGVTEVILAIKSYSKDKTRELLNKLSILNVRLKKLNLIDEYSEASSKPRLQQIKIEDLLERSSIDLNSDEISKTIKDKVVLVTGGGGSIGSELCRQIFSFEPSELIIFDIYENNAYEIQMELLRKKSKNKKYEKIKVTVLIGSVYNYDRLEYVFRTYQPSMVYHAAAYKHVPLMEDSPMEAIRTNVLGTFNCAKLANLYHVEKFVMVSSDKAVRPTNVMGATKRFAEMIVQSHNQESKTVYATVRFGNVLGSNGSVVPLFRKQIEDGGPITVTHPEITRFFMTIPEAVGLILQCGFYAEDGEVFVLDMGEPVKIVDLAKKMIRLSGFKPGDDIDIEFTGLRPGEKMYEELLIDTSCADFSQTANQKIFVEKQEKVTKAQLKIDYITKEINHLDIESSKKLLELIVSTYKQTNNNNKI